VALNYRDKIWDKSETEALKLQIERYFITLELDAKPRSTQRGSYKGRRIKSQLGKPYFEKFLNAITEAAIFYEANVQRLPRAKRGQVPDINKKVLLHDIQTATQNLLDIPVGLYQIDPSTEHTRTEGFVIELARYVSSLMKCPLPKYLHHLLSSARNIKRI